MDDWHLALRILPLELINTLYMVVFSTVVAIGIGLPLGVLLFLTQRGGLKEHIALYRIFSLVINVGRSIPFAILLIALIPLSRALVGTSIGTKAAIVPLSIAAIPFFARLVEAALQQIDYGIIESAQVLGLSPYTIVWRILLKEAMPSLLDAITLTFIALIGYSAMAGLVGGGGLGKVAYQYGYQRFNATLMLSTLIILLLLVEAAQWTGNFCRQSYLKRIGKLQ